ncbi:MAG: PepSY domain-containing protein [Rhodospirillales bacterium]|nr:PepSY domain-containing protein [Rhodospirillales bacterium]
MMKRVLLLACLCVPLSAYAAGDDAYTIKVIQDDGSVDVIDLRQSGAVPAPEPESAAEPAVAPAVAPIVETPVAPAGKAKQPVPPPPPKKVAKKAASPPPPQPVKPPPMPVQRSAPVGSEIHRGQAIAIALDYAPPSSDVEVYRSEYQGKTAFSVMFKTDEGYHEVLVDALSGQVLDSRKSDVLNDDAPRPGHLPGGLH